MTGRQSAMVMLAGGLIVGLWVYANRLDPTPAQFPRTAEGIPSTTTASTTTASTTTASATTPCDPGRSACAPHALVLGASVVVDNLSSCASTADVVALATIIDRDASALGGMLESGDILVANDRYLAWLDTTWTPKDPIAGGLLRGLWSMAAARGCHGLHFVNQPAYNELLPYPGNRGAGHSLLLNTAPDCSDGGTIGGAARNLEFSAEWNRQPLITRQAFRAQAGSGIDYDIAGHFMNPAGSTDLDPATAGVESMRYDQRYAFSADPAKGILRHHNGEPRWRVDARPGQSGVRRRLRRRTSRESRRGDDQCERRSHLGPASVPGGGRSRR
jgi:hypothetical protein